MVESQFTRDWANISPDFYHESHRSIERIQFQVACKQCFEAIPSARDNQSISAWYLLQEMEILFGLPGYYFFFILSTINKSDVERIPTCSMFTCHDQYRQRGSFFRTAFVSKAQQMTISFPFLMKVVFQYLQWGSGLPRQCFFQFIRTVHHTVIPDCCLPSLTASIPGALHRFHVNGFYQARLDHFFWCHFHCVLNISSTKVRQFLDRLGVRRGKCGKSGTWFGNPNFARQDLKCSKKFLCAGTIMDHISMSLS